MATTLVDRKIWKNTCDQGTNQLKTRLREELTTTRGRAGHLRRKAVKECGMPLPGAENLWKIAMGGWK